MLNRNEYMRDHMSKRRQYLKQNNLCQDCGKIIVESPHITCENCRTKRRIKYHDYDKRRINELKSTVYDHYGNRCECCGETINEFLTIDHIRGGGNRTRKREGYNPRTLYRWLIDNNYPEGFRILCWNCNCGRHKNNGVCPHNRHTPLSI